ncbi:Rap1a/Tai family immunity protein [Methylobacterium komagatae]|uniref:Rap1a/Tai family immunity protein n=1 Tax=Methylobacterium komagatae TaxID=374425 RepID=A0ABW2BP06_9HYPH
MRNRRVFAVVLLAAGLAAMSAVPGASSGEEAGSATDAAPFERPVQRQGAIDVTRRRTQDLYQACLAEQGAASGWCGAYLMGVADTLTAFGNGGSASGICSPDYTIEELVETFLTWGRSNGSLLGIDMLAGASLAFRRRWPCERSGSPAR